MPIIGHNGHILLHELGKINSWSKLANVNIVMPIF